MLAEALVESGRLDEADRALARYEQRARAVGRRSALLGAVRVRASLRAALGEHAAAAAAFRAGTELAGGLDLPLEHARLEEARGRALALAGRKGEASAALQAACSAYERIGARPYAAAARAHLAGLEPVEAGRPPVVLSAAEAMVARLVSAGLSNREIAEQLVISVKAVEYHLTNIYRRLGVSSPREARPARRAARGGRPAGPLSPAQPLRGRRARGATGRAQGVTTTRPRIRPPTRSANASSRDPSG